MCLPKILNVNSFEFISFSVQQGTLSLVAFMFYVLCTGQ